MAPVKFKHVYEVAFCFVLFAFSYCCASNAKGDSNLQSQMTKMQKTLSILQETVERQNIRISKLEKDNRRQEEHIKELLSVIQDCDNSDIKENNDVNSVNESTNKSITENHQNRQRRGTEKNPLIKRLLIPASSSPSPSQDHVAF
ncbi:uncharacterized protein LOC134231664 [Saccostrea cucullata]|uniref:uncharacterized protein LOC134231664 n=1 Tax=Saccostrea cuccullata TaxID=36930 RepID=UPI002ED16288